jgi:hypothetical protein
MKEWKMPYARLKSACNSETFFVFFFSFLQKMLVGCTQQHPITAQVYSNILCVAQIPKKRTKRETRKTGIKIWFMYEKKMLKHEEMHRRNYRKVTKANHTKSAVIVTSCNVSDTWQPLKVNCTMIQSQYIFTCPKSNLHYSQHR